MVLSPDAIAALRGKEAVQLGSVCTCFADLKEAATYPVTEAVLQKPQRPPKVDRKIEALFLPGRQSNENLLNFQTNAFRSVVGKDVNITILEADMVWTYRENHDLHDADDMTRTLSKGKPFYTWFDVSSDDPRQRPYMWKFFDPSAKIFYSEEATKSVDKFLSKVSDGDFDVVMGLFEGCIVLHMGVAKLLEQGRKIPWRMSVCFGSMPIRDERYLGPLASTKADHPAVMVFGKTDQDYFYSRSNQSGVKPAEEYYSNVTVLEHAGGHMIPNQPPRSQEIFLRILEEVKYYCGQGPKPVDLPLPPRPTSFPILDLVMMAPRKLRVLSLCGGHSCEAVNKMQTAALKSALGPNAEWTYLVGSKVWEYYDGEPIPSDMEKMIAGKSPLYNWYLDKAHEGPGRLNRDKQFDPNVKVDFFDIPEVLERFEKFLDENAEEPNPPFDVVVAFSQGCIMLHMLIGHLRKRKLKDNSRFQNWICGAEQMPWRLSVMVSGMHVRDKAWQRLVETPTKSTHPVIFVNGKADEYFDYARDGFGSMSQEEYYENPMILNHDGSHEFPSGPRGTEIYKTIVDQIHYHCGGRQDSAPPTAPVIAGAAGKFDLKSFLGPPPRKP